MSLPALVLLTGTSEAGKSSAGRYLASRGAQRLKIRTLLLTLTSGRPVDHEGVKTREGFHHDEFLDRLRDRTAASPEPIVAVESFIDANLAETVRDAWPAPCVIVFIDAERTLRVRRHAAADGLHDGRAAAIVDAKDRRKRVLDQWSTWRRLADFWIDNDRSITDLHDALDAVVAHINAKISSGATRMRSYTSAGAVVVSRDLANPRVLLLHQVRTNGERQVVAPKGRLEPDESPLEAAAREVTEEAGVRDLLYAGFLGQQSYEFTDNDGAPARKSVDWFLFAADDHAVHARDTEGFHRAEFLAFDEALAAVTHAEFIPYLCHARDVITWRQAGPLPFSSALSDLVWFLAESAASVLVDTPGAGIALCGSAARGDFVDGWSDVDVVGWGVDPASPVAQRLAALAGDVQDRWGIHTSLRLADDTGYDSSGAGPLYDMKLRAVLARAGSDLPVIAGTSPERTATHGGTLATAANVDLLHQFATERLRLAAETSADRVDRARRTLSVLCSAARIVADATEPGTSLRLPAVVAVLATRWPGGRAVNVVTAYDRLRQSGSADLDVAEHLSRQAPDALLELRDHVEELATPAT